MNMICGIIDQCGRRATTAKCQFLVHMLSVSGSSACECQDNGIIALMSPILAKATLNLHSALHQPQVLSGLM